MSVELGFKTSCFTNVNMVSHFLPFFSSCLDGSSGSDRNNSEPEPKGKPIPRRDAPPKQAQPTPMASLTPQNVW